MPSGSLLRKLLQAYKRRDDQAFEIIVKEIITEERAKHHNLLADDLTHVLEGTLPKQPHRFEAQHPVRGFEPLPKDRERDTVLIDIQEPRHVLSDVILTEDNRDTLLQIIREYRHSDLLRTHALRPRNRLLFCGPPGCGKSLTAAVLAGELDLPLLHARFDAIVSSYLGETASNLRKVFDYASRGTWVLLFDEFDAIGKKRDNAGEHGELKRVVNTFLQLLDSFHSDTLFIAATNYEALLDKALWRRFDEIMYFPMPTKDEVLPLVQLKLSGTPHATIDLRSLVDDLEGLSHADIERVCLDAMRSYLLAGDDILRPEYLVEAVARQRHRTRIAEMAEREARAREEIEH